jgi:hypothetical protein
MVHQKWSFLFFEDGIQGCQGVWPTITSIRPSCPSDKAYVHPLRNIWAYSSIFKHILENIQRICQLRLIANKHVRPSITSLYNVFTPMSIIYDNPDGILYIDRNGIKK